MKFILIIALCCTGLLAQAGQVDLKIGKELPKSLKPLLAKLDLMGSGGDILSSRPELSTSVDRTEYVSKNGKFVLAVEITKNPKLAEGRPIITALYFSNTGKRISRKDDGEWVWPEGNKRIVIDPEALHGEVIKEGEPAAPSNGDKPSN
jgi:uncharacterized protein (DUF433 family)